MSILSPTTEATVVHHVCTHNVYRLHCIIYYIVSSCRVVVIYQKPAMVPSRGSNFLFLLFFLSIRMQQLQLFACILTIYTRKKKHNDIICAQRVHQCNLFRQRFRYLYTAITPVSTSSLLLLLYIYYNLRNLNCYDRRGS